MTSDLQHIFLVAATSFSLSSSSSSLLTNISPMSCKHNLWSNTTMTMPSSSGRTLPSRFDDVNNLAIFSRSSHSASSSTDLNHWTSTSTVVPCRRNTIRFASSFSDTTTGSFPTTTSRTKKLCRQLGMKSEGPSISACKVGAATKHCLPPRRAPCLLLPASTFQACTSTAQADLSHTRL